MFSRHLVRGSESFRLLCASKQTEMCDPAVCDLGSHNHAQTHVPRLEQLGSCSSRGRGATPAPVLSLQRAGPVLTYQACCSRKQMQVRRRERRQVRAGWPSRACSMTVDGFLSPSEPWSPEIGANPFQLGSQPSKLGHVPRDFV